MGVSVQGDLCPVGSLSGRSLGGVSVQEGVSVQKGGLCLREIFVWMVSVRETPCMVMSGRYTSYLNAFLFSNNSNQLTKISIYDGIEFFNLRWQLQ